MQRLSQLLTAIAVAASAFALTFHAEPAGAQDDVSVEAPMGTLSWGVSHEEVLAYHDQLLEARFREQRQGVRDPVRVDRLRKEMRDKSDEYAETWEQLDGDRTGYETSAIAEEVVTGANLGMLTIRNQSGVTYYVFQNNELVKIIIPVDVAALDWLPFHEYVYQLESQYGPATEIEEVEDEYGIPTTMAALWQGETTVLRAENRRNIYNTYLKVFADASWRDTFVASGEAESENGGSSTGVGNMMDRLRSEGRGGANEDVVDRVLGESTDVQIRLRGDAEAGEETTSEARAASPMDDDEVLEDVEQEQRSQRRAPSRSSGSSSDDSGGDDEGSGGGMTIY
jgi:hypothetical protein